VVGIIENMHEVMLSGSKTMNYEGAITMEKESFERKTVDSPQDPTPVEVAKMNKKRDKNLSLYKQ
jgi:hypothetical protein